MQNKAIWKPLTISIILMMVATNIVVGADLVNTASNLKWNDEEPELYVHPTYLEFGEIGTGETAWASFYVENTGGGVLEWGAGCDMDWIEVYHDYGFLNGGDKYVVEVKIDTSYLEGGESYEGDICVTSNGGAAGVCVVVYVEEEPELYVHPTYLEFGEMRTGETAWASFYVENTGGGLLEWGAGWDMNWIEVYPDYGLLNGGDDYEVEVEIDTTNLEEGGSGSIYLTSNGGDAEVCVEVKIEGSTPIYHLPIYPPIASFTYVPQSPITIMFDASCSYDSDGTIVEYNWDFGDGVMGSGITYNHTYIVNGTYTVKLTVIDNDYSTDTITYNVTITNVTSYDICDFINDLGLENITFAHLISLVKLFRYGCLDSIPPEHRPNGVIKNLTEDDINAVVAYFHGDVVLGNNYAKKSCGRECIAVSEKPVHNLNTGENFSTIQAAIDDNDTKDGHTITVYSGVYYENVVVNKSVTLIGNGQPVVEASGRGSAITLTADGITVEGFNVTKGSWGGAGIKVISNHNVITGNTLHNNGAGIVLYDSSNKNSITSNAFVNAGLLVYDSYQNRVKDNTVNGKPLVYLEDALDYVVEDAGQVILVNCTNITVENMDLSNTSVGIELWKTEGSKILNNIVSNNNYGISLYNSSNNNSITGNNVNNNNYGGIALRSSSNNTITGNNVSNNSGSGIRLYDSSNNNTIMGNNVNNNNWGGIILETSNNTITGNTFFSNGITLESSSNNIRDNTFVNDGLSFVGSQYQNTVKDNTVNGKPLVYLEDASDYKVEDAGQVILVNCRNITVENLDLFNTRVGIELQGTEDSTISNNTVCNNGEGISLLYSNNNTITGNNVSNNNYGISLYDSSNNNTITGNNVSNNNYGIWLYDSSNNNTITGNNVSSNVFGIYLADSSNNSSITGNNVNNNVDGIYLWVSSNNTIYFNNFINNTDNVDSHRSTTIWNSPFEITYTYNGTTYESYLGNYWSDYEGTDAEGDGIGDTHYSIDSNEDVSDDYPLMKPFENYIISTSAPA